VDSRSLLSPIDVENLRGSCGYYITAEACRRIVGNLLRITVPADECVFLYPQRWVDDVRRVSPRAVHSKPFPSIFGYTGSRYKALVQTGDEANVRCGTSQHGGAEIFRHFGAKLRWSMLRHP
jgi:hypothetical protein